MLSYRMKISYLLCELSVWSIQILIVKIRKCLLNQTGIIPSPKRFEKWRTCQAFIGVNRCQKLYKAFHQTFIITLTLPSSGKLFESYQWIYTRELWKVLRTFVRKCPNEDEPSMENSIKKLFPIDVSTSEHRRGKKHHTALQIPEIEKTQFLFYERLVFWSKWYTRAIMQVFPIYSRFESIVVCRLWLWSTFDLVRVKSFFFFSECFLDYVIHGSKRFKVYNRILDVRVFSKFFLNWEFFSIKNLRAVFDQKDFFFPSV